MAVPSRVPAGFAPTAGGREPQQNRHQRIQRQCHRARDRRRRIDIVMFVPPPRTRNAPPPPRRGKAGTIRGCSVGSISAARAAGLPWSVPRDLPGVHELVERRAGTLVGLQGEADGTRWVPALGRVDHHVTVGRSMIVCTMQPQPGAGRSVVDGADARRSGVPSRSDLAAGMLMPWSATEDLGDRPGRAAATSTLPFWSLNSRRWSARCRRRGAASRGRPAPDDGPGVST